MAPDHNYTALRLFDLEREDGDLDAAARVLESMKVQIGGPYVAAREVQLARARGDRSTAVEALTRLCTMPTGVSEWPLTAANCAFREAGWGRQAEAVFAAALDRPEVLPQVATLWVEHCTARRHWRCIRQIDGLLARGEVGRRALTSYVSALGHAKARWRIAACLRRYRGVLREHTPCWGTVSFALIVLGWHRAAADWLADWPDRGDVQPWMLFNLVLALRNMGRDREANHVSRAAMKLARDSCTSRHANWLVLDDLIDGDGRDVDGWLDGLDQSSFDEADQYIFQISQILLRRRRAEPANRASVLKSTSRELSALNRRIAVHAVNYVAVLRTYRRAVRRMAADYGPARRFFWKLARRIQAPRMHR